jgi:O-methyltransferase involved in polyketide biosynthesis
MTELRRRLLPARPRNQLVSGSALDPGWTRHLTAGSPAQGLVMYFSRAQVAGFLGLLADRGAGARVVFDTIPGWTATTTTGHRQSAAGRIPPRPFGTVRQALVPLVGEAGITDAQMWPRRKTAASIWVHLYPAATSAMRGLLAITVTFTIPVH